MLLAHLFPRSLTYYSYPTNYSTKDPLFSVLHGVKEQNQVKNPHVSAHAAPHSSVFLM